MDGPTRKGHGTDSYQLGTGEIEIDDKDRRQSNNSRKGGEGVKSALGSSGALPQSSAPCELSFPPLPLSPSSLNRLSSPMRSSLTPPPPPRPPRLSPGKPPQPQTKIPAETRAFPPPPWPYPQASPSPIP